MKGSSYKTASTLFPTDQNPRNSLSAGEKITYPAQLSIQTANGLAINSLKLGGDPGTDELLAIAAYPKSFSALDDVKQSGSYFRKS